MNSGTGSVALIRIQHPILLILTRQTIAKHVMNIHMNRPNENSDENGEVVGEISLEKMKRYISYCKSSVSARLPLFAILRQCYDRKCAPRLSPDAQEMLSSHFVSLRKEVQQVERDNDERSSIPITVRFVFLASERYNQATQSTNFWMHEQST